MATSRVELRCSLSNPSRSAKVGLEINQIAALALHFREGYRYHPAQDEIYINGNNQESIANMRDWETGKKVSIVNEKTNERFSFTFTEAMKDLTRQAIRSGVEAHAISNDCHLILKGHSIHSDPTPILVVRAPTTSATASSSYASTYSYSTADAQKSAKAKYVADATANYAAQVAAMRQSFAIINAEKAADNSKQQNATAVVVPSAKPFIYTVPRAPYYAPSANYDSVPEFGLSAMTPAYASAIADSSYSSVVRTSSVVASNKENNDGCCTIM